MDYQEFHSVCTYAGRKKLVDSTTICNWFLLSLSVKTTTFQSNIIIYTGKAPGEIYAEELERIPHGGQDLCCFATKKKRPQNT